MKKLRFPLLAFILGTLPFLFGLLGYAAAYVLLSERFVRWVPLGRPPGGAAEILDAGLGVVYVRNEAGEVYRCSPCWEKTEPLEEPLVGQQDYDCSYPLKVPEPPAGVLDRFSVWRCYSDGSTYFEYVVLEDGSVLEWGYTSSSLGILAGYPLFVFVGCMIGSLIFIVGIVILLGYRRAQKSRMA